MFWPDIFPVTEIEARFLVEHDTVGIEDILIELSQVFGIPRQLVHLGHHGHHHVERISPPPVIIGFRISLIAHHFLGSFNLSFVG